MELPTSGLPPGYFRLFWDFLDGVLMMMEICDDDDDYGNLHQSIVPAFPYLLAMSADTVEIRFLGFLAIIMIITITKIKKPKPSVTGILLNS